MVRHPELLDADPLPPRQRACPRLLWALLPVVIITIIGIMAGPSHATLGLAALLVWALYALVVWGDQRAFMQAMGDELTVRNITRTHTVRGRDVTRVVHQYNGRRPDFQLVTHQGKVWVPTSRLERGHTTLFTWIDVHAPQAVLDRESTYWREVMQTQELI